MRIIVNHLTRMQPGFICVAGLDVRNFRHVRPVKIGRLRDDLLESKGGPFNIAAIVDLGTVAYIGHPPEMEDHAFDPDKAVKVEDVAAEDFWLMLRKVAKPGFREIFGPDLKSHAISQGSTCALDLKMGKASLGCLTPARSPELTRDRFGRLRMNLDDGQMCCSLGVTDVRLYESDFKTPRREAMEKVVGALVRGVPAIVAIGVGRSFLREGDSEPRHWLQVNSIHLEDDAAWKIA